MSISLNGKRTALLALIVAALITALIVPVSQPDAAQKSPLAGLKLSGKKPKLSQAAVARALKRAQLSSKGAKTKRGTRASGPAKPSPIAGAGAAYPGLYPMSVVVNGGKLITKNDPTKVFDLGAIQPPMFLHGALFVGYPGVPDLYSPMVTLDNSWYGFAPFVAHSSSLNLDFNVQFEPVNTNNGGLVGSEVFIDRNGKLGFKLPLELRAKISTSPGAAIQLPSNCYLGTQTNPIKVDLSTDGKATHGSYTVSGSPIDNSLALRVVDGQFLVPKVQDPNGDGNPADASCGSIYSGIIDQTYGFGSQTRGQNSLSMDLQLYFS